MLFIFFALIMGLDQQSEKVMKNKAARPHSYQDWVGRKLRWVDCTLAGREGGGGLSQYPPGGPQTFPNTTSIDLFSLNPLLTGPWAAYGSTWDHDLASGIDESGERYCHTPVWPWALTLLPQAKLGCVEQRTVLLSLNKIMWPCKASSFAKYPLAKHIEL